jgi:hypothetical protein
VTGVAPGSREPHPLNLTNPERSENMTEQTTRDTMVAETAFCLRFDVLSPKVYGDEDNWTKHILCGVDARVMPEELDLTFSEFEERIGRPALRMAFHAMHERRAGAVWNPETRKYEQKAEAS